jgi:hypothetical protein
MIPFAPFPSIARLSRDMVVTEKLDGTNAQIFIRRIDEDASASVQGSVAVVGEHILYAGSRTRWITPEADNFGFARWVKENAEALAALGPGQHFGEWWGNGVQRGYGLVKGEKRFSLFNTGRWNSERNDGVANDIPITAAISTACREVPVCHVVPALCRWTFDTAKVDEALAHLAKFGSWAAPGFMQPEGVVVFHAKSGQLFKKTLDKNDGHKGA